MDGLPDIPQEESAGAPAWVMTFADLMSLLMCFFVLMLAFSEMDAQRFKLLSGSMRDAFGVQAEIEAKMMPKGTSILTKEFQPGRPKPTPLKTVRQFTVKSNANTLKYVEENAESDKRRKVSEQIAHDAAKIADALAEEIEKRAVDVEVEGNRIIIHILEQASFASGSDDVKGSFQPVLTKIRGLLADVPGLIAVAGHTDDVPISTSRFRSNWDLSAARAVSVAHALMRGAEMDPERFMIAGHADTDPIVPNDSTENRARNRRVDISVIRGNDQEPEQLSVATDPVVDEPAPTAGPGVEE